MPASHFQDADGPDGPWAVNIENQSTGNAVPDNVLLYDGPRMAINTTGRDSLPGFVSDYNAMTNRFSTDDGESFLTLARWRDATGQGENSLASNPSALFVDAANGYNLSAASPAVDAGRTSAPTSSAVPPRPGHYPAGDLRRTGLKRQSPLRHRHLDDRRGLQLDGALRPDDGLREGAVEHERRRQARDHTVAGLSANAHYHFGVESEGEVGNPAASADLTFKTAR